VHVSSGVDRWAHLLWSGKRDSNPRPRAWKARALPTELFPPRFSSSPVLGGEGRIRTSEGVRRQIYSLLPLAAREPLPKHSLLLRAHLSRWRESNSQPTDYKSVALPLSYIGPEQGTFCLIAVIMGSQADCFPNNGRFWPYASSRPFNYYLHH
jgi:hypothetical protein